MADVALMWTLLLVAAAAPVPAAAPVTDGAEVVVTATRAAGLTDTAPYPVIVIDRAQLAPSASIADALADVAEVYVQAPGGRSGTAALFVRGGDPNFTTVLFDGVALNNPANILGGSVNVSEYGEAAFERVEVVAGPVSSVYGSGALAGVVNLVVPGGLPTAQGDVQASLGSALDRTLFGRVRGPLGATTGGSLALSYDDAGDIVAPSRFRSVAAIGKIAPLGTDDGGRAVFRAARTNSRGFPDASGGDRLATLRRLEVREGDELVIGGTQPVVRGKAVRVDVSGSLLARRDRVDTPGVRPSATDAFGVPGGTDTTRYRRATLRGLARYMTGGWQGVAGVEAQHELARSEGVLRLFGKALPSGFRGSRASTAAFVEASLTTPSWVVNAGARIDRIDGLGTHATGRIGVNRVIGGTGFSLHASAATGFKAPSFYALGNPFVGNPLLRPERSAAMEAGVTWSTERSRLSLTAFRTRYTDLIDFVPFPVPRLENRARVVTRGISFAASHAAGDSVTLAVQAQLLDARDAATGERLLNRPRWRAGATTGWSPIASLRLTARTTLVSERLGFSVPTGIVALGGYRSVAVDAAFVMSSGATLRLIVDNAFDGTNEDAVGFTAPGRRARLLVTHSF